MRMAGWRALAAVLVGSLLPAWSAHAADLPQAVRDAVEKAFPNAAIREVGQETENGVRYYEVNLLLNGNRIEVEGDRDFAISCMKRGVAALCIEQRSFGERAEKLQKQVSPQGCHDATMQALLLGKTLIGERVFDVDRGIDYLTSRGDVDMRRIGVMGNSGGGTITLFSAALLPRVRYAMPSCYFCTFRDSIMSIYHCADNYIPGLLRYAEMADVMGLFAPRPVLVVAGEQDPIFPIHGTRKAFRRLKRIYRAAGAADRCHLVVGEGGHRFYADLAWPRMLAELKRDE